MITLNYNLLFHYFITFKLNIKNYNIFLHFISNGKNIYILNNSSNFRYNWSEIYNYEADININFIFLKKSKNNQCLNLINNYSDKVSDLILLKKRSSVFKKNYDKNYLILNKISLYKDNFNKNFFNKKKNIFFQKEFNVKNFDFKKKLKLIIKKNRKIVVDFFNLKYYRNFSISKNLKKICNLKKFDLLINLENSLLNIVIKSDFFFSKNDCTWFIKNGLVSVNSNIILNPNFRLKTYDIVNLAFLENYFLYYKSNLSFLLDNLYKINLKLWSINNNRFKNIEKKKSDIKEESYPKWIKNYQYFKKDIPLYLEVDYISMTIVLLDNELNFNHLDYYNFKLISLFMSRSYNWKYII